MYVVSLAYIDANLICFKYANLELWSPIYFSQYVHVSFIVLVSVAVAFDLHGLLVSKCKWQMFH